MLLEEINQNPQKGAKHQQNVYIRKITGRLHRDRMVVGFTFLCGISA